MNRKQNLSPLLALEVQVKRQLVYGNCCGHVVRVYIYKMKCVTNFGDSASHVEKMRCDEDCFRIASSICTTSPSTKPVICKGKIHISRGLHIIAKCDVNFSGLTPCMNIGIS